MKQAPDTREALRRSTAAALVYANGHQGAAAKALGINLRTVQKRLAALFSAEERAAMAERYGWVGVRAAKGKAPTNWATKPREMERWAKAEAAVKAAMAGDPPKEKSK